MTDIFIGIESSNEFFTQHYLTAILKGDLQPRLTKWREEAEARALETDQPARTPRQALDQLNRPFFEYREALRAKLKRPGARVQAHREFFGQLLVTLGYTSAPSVVELPSGHLPRLAAVSRMSGAPLLWCVPVASAFAEPIAEDALDESTEAAADGDSSTLKRALLAEQYELAAPELDSELRVPSVTIEALVNEAFNLDEPPRFILICGETDLILAERVKWTEQRLLTFDLEEIFGRREPDTLDVTAAILHRDCLVPVDGAPLLDTLDDNSHKHAFEVSEDLKFALQACIERLGNAAITQLRDKQRLQKKKMAGADDAEQLARECLRYMYRLLFLFYIEARPELGYAPMGADAYRLGYSLERLRDLEQLDLQTDEARRGSYIHESLQRLFTMIHDGTPGSAQITAVQDSDGALATSHIHTFRLSPLRSHLFDPRRTPLLAEVVFPNEVLRDILEWMSLTRSGKRRGRGLSRRRGRISYATLGINQLGAVYEALLSFRGFFAEEDLFEVKPAGEDNHDVLKTAYFVPEADLDKYSESERVYEAGKADDDTKNALKRYPRGTFIYRLAGRDRQTSASYYTPEVLTRCLVKYALKELLENERGEPKKSADEILKITLCEPAMGSAAFLNEAVSQLADAYLAAKQRELGERIAHDRYAYEKQRVKMLIADNNVYGVDLNPIAVELAEVSLWLNTIHEGGFVPWFGGQTVCGNSLIGARREVFSRAEVSAGPTKKATEWLTAIPKRVPLRGKKRPAGSIYHFLLGDRGMAVYGQGSEGKPIREMAKTQLAKIETWRRAFCAPVEDDDREAMVALSDAIDQLWHKHAELLQTIRTRTTDPLAVYGKPLAAGERAPTTTAYKDAVWEKEMLSRQVRASSPYRRLQLVMDYWCALWLWPIEQADLLPERDEYLSDLALLLDTDVLTSLQGDPQKDLFAPTMPADEAKALARELGVVDVDQLISRSPRLQLVIELKKRHRFLHWELEFADLFATRGGFDLMLGNPPWIKIQWSEQDLLGDTDPVFVLKGLSSTETAQRREGALAAPGSRTRYYEGHEAAAGTQSFLSARQNYPELQGIQPNLFKCFLPVVWRWASPDGTSGLLHPEGVYDDPKGGLLRSKMYPRLRRHYQFRNEMTLFEGTNDHGRLTFSINIYGPGLDAPRFAHIANLFSPATIDACHTHPGGGQSPGVKDAGKWVVEGHADRVIQVGKKDLALFAALYDEEGTPPVQARLPALHSRQLVSVLRRFAEAKRRLGDIEQVFNHDMWHESRARKAGIIARSEPAVFPFAPEDLVLSGPHFFVGNPHYKTPRRKCTNGSDYDPLDLVELPADYLPRTNYVPACSHDEYQRRTPTVPWDDEAPVTDFYRLVVNRQLNIVMERTLQPALIPPGACHIDSVYTYTFADIGELVNASASWASLPMDFIVKAMGVSDFRPNLARQLPLASTFLPELQVRALLLNCLTLHYAPIWQELYDPAFARDRWSKDDPRLPGGHFAALTKQWTWDTPLRTDYARRQALVEIDVLVAMGLGFTLEQLQTLYRVQFYVLRQNEADTWYDRNGRIVFTCSKGLPGVGLPRTAPRGSSTPGWEDVKDMKSGVVERKIVDDDTLPGGPRERTIVYEAPFSGPCDRERDYAIAWRHFEERFADQRTADKPPQATLQEHPAP